MPNLPYLPFAIAFAVALGLVGSINSLKALGEVGRLKRQLTLLQIEISKMQKVAA